MLEESEVVETESFGVYQDNWLSFKVFWALRRQWNLIPAPTKLIYLSIKAEAIAAVLGLFKINNSEQVFSDLQEMEDAALPILNN